MIRTVQHTSEFARVAAISRRIADPSQAFADRISSALLMPGSIARLRPLQAEALYEAAACKGLLAALGVGEGKTLISLLAPTVLGASRPLLILPAKLREKTKREQRAYLRDWRIPKHLRIESYEKLSRAEAASELSRYRPDLIILDEAHKCKNARAAVTRRLSRFLAGSPDTKVIALSGTITKRSLRDYAHVLSWTHRHSNPPITRSFEELINWCDALDERTNSWFGSRCEPGALLTLATAEDALAAAGDPLRMARLGYSRRLTETAGVITSTASALGASLSVSTADVPGAASPALTDAWESLRDAWVMPNGIECLDGIEVWRHARELALGFYYQWDPPPPDTWREARKAWARVVRHILRTNRRDLDTEAQVARAVAGGHYDGTDAPAAYRAWCAVKGSYTPATSPVWLDHRVLTYCAEWLAREGGICWVEHRAFGEELSRLSGLAYYAAQGLAADGRNIEDARGPIIASERANNEGRNLQDRYHSNLIVSCSKSGMTLEQTIGRTHRPGQQADEVTVEIVTTCTEHIAAIYQARKDARYIQDTTGNVQKLNYCDFDAPPIDHFMARGETDPAWRT